MENYVVEEYRDDFKLLLEVKDIAKHLHYKNKSNVDFKIRLEEIIKNADEAIIHLVKEFSDFDTADIQPVEEETDDVKLGYAFTWLRKLKSAANGDETEKILQDWLKEISEKKPAEND